jgi:hypothetical protein
LEGGSRGFGPRREGWVRVGWGHHLGTDVVEVVFVAGEIGLDCSLVFVVVVVVVAVPVAESEVGAVVVSAAVAAVAVVVVAWVAEARCDM